MIALSVRLWWAKLRLAVVQALIRHERARMLARYQPPAPPAAPKVWFAETWSSGRWWPVTFHNDEPVVKKGRLMRNSGPGPQIRNVKLVPPHLIGRRLEDISKVLSGGEGKDGTS